MGVVNGESRRMDDQMEVGIRVSEQMTFSFKWKGMEKFISTYARGGPAKCAQCNRRRGKVKT